jgi:hypothetical protein
MREATFFVTTGNGERLKGADGVLARHNSAVTYVGTVLADVVYFPVGVGGPLVGGALGCRAWERTLPSR